jgi:hypothetical protein
MTASQTGGHDVGKPGVSAPFGTPMPRASGTCPLCDLAVAADDTRCGSCGYHLAGVDGRPGPFSRPALWWMLTALAIVYLVTLLVVLAAR